ncbi:MAG: 6-carboxytetrahydropterin synthase [Planctomycetota bacterium]
MFEIAVEKTFSAAHALRLPGGEFEPVHGHNWRVRVTVAAEGLDAMDTVMDFHRLEELVESVVGPWRNRDLNGLTPFAAAPGSGPHAGGVLAVNPSAERVAERIAWAVGGGLPEGVWLHDVSVTEAPGCLARYRP